jgi:CBS domain-containing protein
MTTQPRTLTYRAITRDTTLKNPDPVKLSDPATRVMTDFNVTRAFSIAPSATLSQTNQSMIDRGVRLLFVCDGDGTLLGLVTATDTLGEKPVLYVNEHGGTRDDILAKDIMTPKHDLMALEMRDVANSTIGDIAETMKTFGRQHILVIESSETGGGEVISGLFSTSQIQRQLGVTIELSGRAHTFAELEQAIGAG